MSTARRFLIAFWLVASSCIGSPSICSADSDVALHGDSDLHGPTVRLSDLFSGVPPVIDRDIAQAPAPGKSAVYDADLLQKLAGKYRLSWHQTDVTDHVTVTTPATRITADDLHAAISRKLEESGVHGDIEINFDGRAPEIDLPASQSPDFTLSNFEFDQVSKRFRCELSAGKGSAAVAETLNGHAAIKRRVPVLARHIESGAVIAMTDIDWAIVPDERVVANVITSADQLIGREARHPLSDGDILHTNDVMPARLVTRGSLVTLKIQTPFMQLTAQGRALQDGAEGDSVRVTNTQSNRIVEGTVTASGEVSVKGLTPKLALAQDTKG